MNPGPPVDWQEETQRYRQPHPRLCAIARLLARLPQRRLLDVGCSMATLKDLLPADFDYHGCDVADHAAARLDAVHFRQLDLNRAPDFSAFAGRQIDVVCIGGVLEYLTQPAETLAAARRLVAPGAPGAPGALGAPGAPGGCLLVSLINFQARRYADPARHHPGWVFRPPLEDLRELVQGAGWRLERQVAFFGRGPLREPALRFAARLLGPDHPWTRRTARQFILIARAG